MKILRLNNNFKKVPDNNINDAVTIKSLIEQGWKYCSRKEYKDFFGVKNEVNTDNVKVEEPKLVDNIEKKKKHGKNK